MTKVFLILDNFEASGIYYFLVNIIISKKMIEMICTILNLLVHCDLC